MRHRGRSQDYRTPVKDCLPHRLTVPDPGMVTVHAAVAGAGWSVVLRELMSVWKELSADIRGTAQLRGQTGAFAGRRAGGISW